MKTLYEHLSELENGDINAALCSVINTSGSTPRKHGAKMIVKEDGRIIGSVGGGSLEKVVIQDALNVIKNKVPQLFDHALVQQHAMCCGGKVQVYIEPIMKKQKLYIFGSGHIGKALLNLSNNIEFDTTIIDNRAEELPSEGESYKIVFQHHIEAIKSLSFDSSTYVVIATYDHTFDREILSLCLKQKHAYIGMVGSNRKVTIAKKNLLNSQGISQADLDKVDMPIGLDINAETPAEIAISIAAKLVKVRQSLQAGSSQLKLKAVKVVEG